MSSDLQRALMIVEPKMNNQGFVLTRPQSSFGVILKYQSEREPVSKVISRPNVHCHVAVKTEYGIKNSFD